MVLYNNMQCFEYCDYIIQYQTLRIDLYCGCSKHSLVHVSKGVEKLTPIRGIFHTDPTSTILTITDNLLPAEMRN
jgi:hypothetical protein